MLAARRLAGLLVSFALLLLSADAVRLAAIDKAKLRYAAHAWGVSSFLETRVLLRQRAPGVSPVVSPEDVAASKFEIKCSTQCDFVPKGKMYAPSPRAALPEPMIAAEELQALLLRQHNLEAKKDTFQPGDASYAEFMAELETVTRLARSKQLELEAIAAADNDPKDVDPEQENKLLMDARADLEDLQNQLALAPNDVALKKLQDAVKEQKATLKASEDAAAAADKRKLGMDAQLKELELSLEMKRKRNAIAPTDADSAMELTAIEKQLQVLGSEASGMKPAAECARVCVNAAQKTGATANCVRLCTKVMRVMVQQMATTFL